MTTTRLYTAEDLCRMPGDEPWELWDGELRRVSGSAGRASRVGARILTRIGVYLESNDLGMVTGADGTYVLSRDRDTVVVPDVAFLRWDRLPDCEVPIRYVPVPPDLAVEVQSPSDEPKAMAEKRALYARAGVSLLCWVNPDARTVTVHRPEEEPVELIEADTLDVLAGFSIPVSDIFA